MKFWKKRVNDWTGVDATLYIAELTAIIYGVVGIVIFWSSIVNWFKDRLMKIRRFITKHIPNKLEEDSEI